MPPPSRLNFARRGAWQAAYERAVAIGNSREVRDALIVELWYCENPDDDTSHAWTKVVAVAFVDDSWCLVEKAPLGRQIVVARIEERRCSFVMPARFYAPAVKLP